MLKHFFNSPTFLGSPIFFGLQKNLSSKKWSDVKMTPIKMDDDIAHALLHLNRLSPGDYSF